jgi:hypothetical protein
MAPPFGLARPDSLLVDFVRSSTDQAADAYAAWKKVQEGDVTRNAAILRQQLSAGISVQASRLKSLEDQQQQVESNLQLVANADTTAALDFRNQLTSAQLLLGIEIGDVSFRLERIQDFLRSNY